MNLDLEKKQSPWYGCYGVACAKLLAQVDDDKHQSALNGNFKTLYTVSLKLTLFFLADNYALYALAAHLASTTLKYRKYQYPWLPIIDQWDGENFLAPSIDLRLPTPQYTAMLLQDRYDKANLGYFTYRQPSSEFGNITLAQTRRASLLDKNLTLQAGYSVGFHSAKKSFNDDIHAKMASALINWDADIKYQCVNNTGMKSKPTWQHPDFNTNNTVQFNTSFAENWVEDYCRLFWRGERSWNVHLVPYISRGNCLYPFPSPLRGSETKQAVVQMPSRFGDDLSPRYLHIGIQLDNKMSPNTFRINATAQVFEGNSSTQQLANCKNTFLNITAIVSQVNLNFTQYEQWMAD